MKRRSQNLRSDLRTGTGCRDSRKPETLEHPVRDTASSAVRQHQGQHPAVSVIMAVHNAMPYLPEAIDSICEQTLEEHEFLIIDDGSSDGSREWLQRCAQEDSRIHLITQSRAGLTVSLNRLLSIAKGQLIARMDADDVSHPERLKKQVAFLEANPDVVLLGCQVELTTEDGLPLWLRNHATKHAEIRRRLLMGDGGALTHPAVVMRRWALDAIGGYDERFTTAQDLDLFLRLSEIGEARNLEEPLLSWRQHPKSVNRTRSATWQDMKRLALKNTLERCSAEQIAAELFPVSKKFSFPEKSLDVARHADLRGNHKTALRLAARAWLRGDRRMEASRLALKVWIKSAVHLLRQAFSRDGDRS